MGGSGSVTYRRGMMLLANIESTVNRLMNVCECGDGSSDLTVCVASPVYWF